MQQEQELNPALEIINRLRSLENSYSVLGEHMLVINQNMIEEYKKFTLEFKDLNDTTKKLDEEITRTKEALKRLAKDMEPFAKQTDIKILEKYINMWNPIEFMTRNDVQKLIDEKIKGGKSGSRKSNK